ncbi:hypothetical protein LMG8520_2591 [Lactococcus lactis subsp. lactis]|uniref:Uncharacterized protein n=1 Tax=Lactococcus lactis subsp. lactis TaxID=1360 RepID=A0A0V8CVV5_LACLL|nr:hypothetical protein LMG8520_2591 [Lactococcus lactis subsp. lactis]
MNYFFSEKHRKTKDFEMFIETLEKYKFNNIKNFALFIQKKRNSEIWHIFRLEISV